MFASFLNYIDYRNIRFNLTSSDLENPLQVHYIVHYIVHFIVHRTFHSTLHYENSIMVQSKIIEHSFFGLSKHIFTVRPELDIASSFIMKLLPSNDCEFLTRKFLDSPFKRFIYKKSSTISTYQFSSVGGWNTLLKV